MNPTRFDQTPAMKRGVELELHAATIYANVAKNGRVNVFPSGLIIHPKCPWLGCSPDWKVYDLERQETTKNDINYYQVQCQLGLTGLDWCDFFSYMNDDMFVCTRTFFWIQFFIRELKIRWTIFFQLLS